jgi:prophage DNA circulation protein
MANWRDSIQKASFRGIPFQLEDSSSETGRRAVTHEYIQAVTYVEDLGRKTRKFQLNGWVCGDDFEAQRDKLIEACEKPGSGILIFSDWKGAITCVCESCTVTENKSEQRIVKFAFSFIETGLQFSIVTKTTGNLQKGIPGAIAKIGEYFAMGQSFLNMPAEMISQLSGELEKLTGVSVWGLLSGVSALKNLINCPISLGWELPALASSFTSVFNNDYSTLGTRYSLKGLTSSIYTNPELNTFSSTGGNIYSTAVAQPEFEIVETNGQVSQTNTIDARQALQTYLQIVNNQVTHVSVYSPLTEVLNREGKRVELLIKSNCILEACMASTVIDFESVNEAQLIWSDIMAGFEQTIGLAAEINDDASYKILRTQRALFQKDIQERAPSLSKVLHLELNDITPSLVLAYDAYEAIDRAGEVQLRNRIRHPGFCYGSVEILSDE